MSGGRTLRSICGIAALLLLLAPGRATAGPMGDRADQDYAFVLTTDFWSAAYYSTIEVEPPRDTRVSIAPVSTDAVAHYDYGEDMVFVVNRYLADNIQIVDPNQNFATVGQYSVGNGTNPHDIRLASHTKAYVSRFESTDLLIVNPFTGAVLDSIDLSVLADADGIPEMDRMEIVDGKLFVTLNSINHSTWLPAGPGKVAVIDVATDALIDVDPGTPGIQPIVLNLPNPYSELRYSPARQELVVACLGAWGVLDGGIEAIDPFTLESKGVVISEAGLGGDVTDALIAGDGKGYAVVLDPDPWPDNFGRLVAFDSVAGTVIDTLYAQTSGLGSSLAGIEMNTQGEVYLCDRDAAQPGVRIYDASADTLIVKIDVGVPPYDVAFVQPPYFLRVAEDARDGEPERQFLGQNYPNPFNPETVIPFSLPEGARVTLEVFDVRGRRVAGLLEGWLPAGAHSARWSGRTDMGAEAPAGIYFCRLSAGEQVATRKMLMIR
jgi:hypothetical protein